MLRCVANRTNPVHEAERLARWQLAEVGRELRVARITGGRTQAAVAHAIGTSVARISRLERGLVPTVTHRQLARMAGATGLRLYIRAYPAGRRLLDAPQLALLGELRRRAHSDWQWETEVPIPIPGDLRAVDACATMPDCRVAVELWTRLADWQAQSRAALLKRRDLGADRLVVVLRDTRANREALRQAGTDALASFPVLPRAVLRALAERRDPAGNGVVFL
jgi:transcriptional regulator with XRE-family HTH domain